MGKSGEEAGKISIHALREEGDFWALSTSSPRSVFLSTPSARRATESGTSLDKASPISIHALREEGDGLTHQRDCLVAYFYPRPPRGGRPSFSLSSNGTVNYFYPRPPRGGRLITSVMG